MVSLSCVRDRLLTQRFFGDVDPGLFRQSCLSCLSVLASHRFCFRRILAKHKSLACLRFSISITQIHRKERNRELGSGARQQFPRKLTASPDVIETRVQIFGPYVTRPFFAMMFSIFAKNYFRFKSRVQSSTTLTESGFAVGVGPESWSTRAMIPPERPPLVAAAVAAAAAAG